ncbi:hypothetical protein NGRA_0701 [Nosema granulosis]|uniref:Non-structural maintenance of chromosome element 4 C-terminal domain-containing protein n=1 Tax=Nosema granulosis TaxID=83296 RepID=A0A9P6H2K1_9MICR|nr:hypothetical protein NGRA_0701 [Nosema granulosis]
MSIHSEYMEILKKIKTNKEILDENTSELFNIVEASNTLLSNIENTSDLKLDAKISSIYSEVYLKLFQKNINGKAITMESIISFLNSKKSDEFLHKLQSTSKSLQFVNFIDFNYTLVKKQRKASQRIEINIKDAETPEETNTVPDLEKSKFLVDLSKKLQQVSFLPYYKTVLDGDSFSNTIENVFNLSIAIRSKDVMLVVKEDNVFITAFKDTGTTYNEHIIEDLDYKRFLSLRKKYLSY